MNKSQLSIFLSPVESDRDSREGKGGGNERGDFYTSEVVEEFLLCACEI